ncbi:hypothetical protein [[Enterobacter] lignolyticus]|uniref:Morphogenetic protein n=1 Tax=Enterobacter lignolyticus (strain SCF1) TaxID=701347 RepID=E3G2S0_ENTLS|nr:hypothetical protein [[Enterobacter] lignolyticus]ADO48101.1 hypothetical protein Entcl_1845 [[Enterobacter] lignolyticus SCF1]
MIERGMIFNSEMVRALLDGRKTQTRRPVKFKPREPGLDLNSIGLGLGYYCNGAPDRGYVLRSRGGACWNDRTYPAHCPHGKPGDRIWVRETWTPESIDAEDGSYSPDYRATANGQPVSGKWTPSIHMPRRASRILLEVSDVRVERLNDISEADAQAEGVAQLRGGYWKHYQPEWTQHQLSARGSFVTLWKSIYGEESWQANPWVWVIEFKRIQGGEA